MKPEHEQYILNHIGRKSVETIAKELGLKERKVKRFLERQGAKEAATAPSVETKPVLSRGKVFLSVILIALLGFAVYANSINGKFIWDDSHHVEDNAYIRDWSNLPKFFTESMAAGADAPTLYSFYRPFQLITYTLDYSIWKLDPRGYHLTNIILHVLASLSIFWLISVLYKDWKLSLFTSLLFVVHPVHTEAVSYIAGRADSLVLMFMFLCFVFYIKALDRNKISSYILMTASYILAVLSKELSLILPVFLFLYHYTFRRKILWKAILPVLAINIGYIVLRLTTLKFLSSNVVHKTTYMQRAAGFFIAMVNYIKVMVLPTDLHMEYGNSFFNFTYPRSWAGIAVVIVLIILIMRTRAARNIVFFTLTWFMIGILPASGLIYPINAYMAEHWLYLPSIGIFLLLSKGLVLLFEEKGLKSISVGALILFLGFYAFLTVNQNGYWKAPIPFYERTLKYANNSSRVYFNLANEYRRIGEFDRSVMNYHKALKVRPDYHEAYYNLGKAYEGQGERQKAIGAYLKVLEIDPKYDKAHYNLGNMYYELGRIEEALASYERTIEANPDHIKAYNNLGVAFVAAGRHDEAEGLFKKAIAMDASHAMAYGNLAIFYFGRQRVDEAVEYYQKAVDLGFEDPKFAKKITPFLK